MRQLKFRAWNGKNMILPELADWDDFFILPDGEIGFMDEDNRVYSSHRFLGYRKDWEVMQFIGRKDKNDREIYEGDIVLNQYGHYEGWVKWFDELYWDGGGSSHPGFWFTVLKYADENDCDLNFHTSFDKVEVIGNIYENPELIENKQ